MSVFSTYSLFNIGTNAAKSHQEANRIRLTNTIAIVPLFILFFSTFYCVFGDYLRLATVNICSIGVTLLVLYLNHKHRFTAAKSLLICNHAVTILIYFKLMADEPSVFFYYFSVLLSFIIFYNPKEEKKVIIFTGLFVLACIFCTLFLPNQLFKPFPLPASLHRFIYIFNSIVCVTLAAIFLFRIFKVNILNETSLVTAKKAAEQAADAKTIFLSNMSHELRTPLNGIIGTSHILKSEKYLESQEEHISVLSNLSEHMLGLVNNILDYSKIDAGKLELNNYNFTLKDFVDKTYLTFKGLFDEKGVSYKIDVDERLLTLSFFADGLRLQQVMNNLLSNALKFTNKDGVVTVSIATIKKTDTHIKLFISVSDTGIGISKSHISEIFESFKQGDSATTRMYGGSGLGLTISKNLVSSFGGSLNVKSELGKGSNFFFDVNLPIAQANQQVLESAAITTLSLQNIRLLLVEDNKVNMMVARKILQKWGVQVVEAENGAIAYEKSQQEDFDIILLDLEMPVMDGKTAAQKINALNKQTPIVAFTAGLYEDMKSDLLKAGFTDYIHKPFMPDDLYRKILFCLNKKADLN
jgi:signal transduction histidine kinase/CheY-like chemotaxis protein